MERLFTLRKDLSISIKEFLSFKYNDANFQQKTIETSNRKGTTIPSIASNNSSLLLHKSKGCQKLINNIVAKMEAHCGSRKKYIDIDIVGFSEQEVETINNNPKIFFKCTTKRTILVKWIIDEMEKYFERHNTAIVRFWYLYDFLSSRFKTKTLNKSNLIRLFEIDNFLEYDKFIKIRDSLLKENSRYLTPSHPSKNLEKQFFKSPSANQITKIITKMEEYFAIEQKYISLYNNFSSEEIEIIDDNPAIFFKCTSKRVVLVKWIVQEVENYFNTQNISYIFLDNLYNFLRTRFMVNNFNRSNFLELFKVKNILRFSDFVVIKNKTIKEYRKYHDPFKIIDRDSKCIESNFEITSSSDNIDMETVLDSAKKVLEDELYQYFSNNSKETSYLIQLITEKNVFISVITEIRKKLKNVDKSLLSAKVIPLLFAYINDSTIRDRLIELFKEKNILLVKDLPQILIGSLDECILHNNLIGFINFLSNDKVSFVKEKYLKIFKSERNRSILLMRSMGKTLEETGQKHSLTRERIRQIESKIIRNFLSFLARTKARYILHAFSDNDNILSPETIYDLLGKESDIFIYCLRRSKKVEMFWSDILQGFVLDSKKWYEEIIKYSETLPDMFEASLLNSYIDTVKDSLSVDVHSSIIEKIIMYDYYLEGQIYTRITLRKTDIYETVLRKFYPYGIKLFDKLELLRFKSRVKDLFGDISLPEKDRAIWARITDVTILCGRGKYILPDRIKCDGELLNKIYQYIQESSRNVIMYVELFEVFKRELLTKTNINNRYFLHGVLRYIFDDKLSFTRDSVVKDTSRKHNIRKSIEKFIRERKKVVTKEEILKEFKGITDIVFYNATTQNPNILLWNYGEYFHTKHLKIEPEIKKRLKEILVNYINKGPITSNKIYDDIYSTEKNFLLSNKVHSHYALFSLLNYLFPNEFKFRRPFIVQKDFPKEITFNNIVREYLSVYEEIDIADLQDYLYSIGKGNNSISILLDNISDEFIRADENMLIRSSLLNLSAERIKEIEDIALALIQNNSDFLVVSRMKEYLLFPDIGLKWNPFLLVSVVKYYCKRLKIISKKVDYRYINEIIVDSRLNIDNYQHLLQYILRKEHKKMPFRTLKELREYLNNKGLADKEIPEILFKNRFLFKDKDGSVSIN